jgi:RNA polymerase sigma-70 factor (ECF subfamily)
MAAEAATAGEAIARQTAEAVARRSYGSLVALLAARTRDVAGAEDALSSAFAAALEAWPAKGVPRSPEAWLLTVARRKKIDAARRCRRADEAASELRRVAEEQRAAADAAREHAAGSCALRLVCAHPAIDPGLRAPLVLQALLGFDAAEIASAFRVPPAAMSQRLVRAKRKVRAAGLRFQPPAGAELEARIDSVLEAVCAACARAGGGRGVQGRGTCPRL